jgi:hypothetical protein
MAEEKELLRIQDGRDDVFRMNEIMSLFLNVISFNQAVVFKI